MTLTQVSEPSGGFQPDGLSELVIQHLAGVGLKVTLQYVPSSEWSRLLLLNEVQLWGPTGQQGGPVPPTPDMHWGPLMHAWAGSGGADDSQDLDRERGTGAIIQGLVRVDRCGASLPNGVWDVSGAVDCVGHRLST